MFMRSCKDSKVACTTIIKIYTVTPTSLKLTEMQSLDAISLILIRALKHTYIIIKIGIKKSGYLKTNNNTYSHRHMFSLLK